MKTTDTKKFISIKKLRKKINYIKDRAKNSIFFIKIFQKTFQKDTKNSLLFCHNMV